MKPIYASEIGKDAEKTKIDVDKMAEDLGKVQINPEADSVEKAWQGSISLEHHRADIAKMRDRFMLCTAALEDKIKAKEAGGKVATAEREQLKECLGHCKAILDTMDKMHYNSSVLTTATRKLVFLNGWGKHKRMMAQLRDQMKNCPMMVTKTLACCEIENKGMGNK